MIFDKKIGQFREIYNLRQKYKKAEYDYSCALGNVTNSREIGDHTPQATHNNAGCILRDTILIFDSQGLPEGISEISKIYCKCFDWNKACDNQKCQYQKRNAKMIQAQKEYEQTYEQLRHARKRFWGLEK